MAQPTETFDTFDAQGNREDLSDIIDIMPVDETPFLKSVGKSEATSTLHEWQTDSLGTASTSNAHIQGNDFAGTAIVATSRLNNRTQISKKEIVVSGTQEVVDKAGRESEMAHQKAKMGRILAMDMEAILTGNQAPVTGNSTTASKLRSLESWYTTNDDRGAGGADGSTSAAATDGTQRAFTEDLLKNVLQLCYTAGGNPNMIMLGAFNRRKLSEFAGNATRFVNANEGKLMTSIKVYESDFGDLKVMPNRHSRSRTCHVIDTSKFKVAYLRPMFSEPIAKTGDAFKEQMIVEYTLEALNEASSGVVADLNTV